MADWARSQVYALLGLVKKWGAERVEAACASALDHEAINVGLIGRMLERGTEGTAIQPALPGTVIPGRFARDPSYFTVRPPHRPHPGIDPGGPQPADAIVEAAFAAALEEEAR